MFALAVHSMQATWEGRGGSSTFRPMFYFLTVSEVHRGLPNFLRATGVHGDICRTLLDLSTSSFRHPNLTKGGGKSKGLRPRCDADGRTHSSASVLTQVSHCFLFYQSVKVPVKAHSGAGMNLKRVPLENTQQLKSLTDSSLGQRPPQPAQVRETT